MKSKNINFMDTIDKFETLAEKYKDNEGQYKYLKDIANALCDVEIATSNFYKFVGELKEDDENIN